MGIVFNKSRVLWFALDPYVPFQSHLLGGINGQPLKKVPGGGPFLKEIRKKQRITRREEIGPKSAKIRRPLQIDGQVHQNPPEDDSPHRPGIWGPGRFNALSWLAHAQ